MVRSRSGAVGLTRGVPSRLVWKGVEFLEGTKDVERLSLGWDGWKGPRKGLGSQCDPVGGENGLFRKEERDYQFRICRNSRPRLWRRDLRGV